MNVEYLSRTRNKLLQYFALMVTISSIIACMPWYEIILETNDVASLKVIDTGSNKSTHLKISGLALHSALTVKDITTEKEMDSMNIFVHLVPAKKGLSGSFVFETDVPQDIDIVRFGKFKVVIWKRRIPLAVMDSDGALQDGI